MVSRLVEIFQHNVSDCKLCGVLETVIDEILEPIVVVDDQGIIVFFNKAYCKFLNITRDEAIGRHVAEIIENTRLHVVCHEKVLEIDHVQIIRGKQALVCRIPLFLEGEFLGAIGKVNFQDVSDVQDLIQKLNDLSLKVQRYKNNLKPIANYTFKDIIGNSELSSQVKNQAAKIARTTANVLILGETGVGKELFAHSIHNASVRCNKPFISINCAAIPQELLESELFGYAEGAFSGARKSGKLGKFELANEGTVFLDEVGEMSLRMQAKLLRVLQDGQVEKLGGTDKKNVDVRVIAASNLDLENEVKHKRFRADLYYRLSTLTLYVPPLRKRVEDIRPIVEYLLLQNNNYEQRVKKFSSEAIEQLALYHWPGNVRELVNIVERLFIMEDVNIILKEHVRRALNRDATEECNVADSDILEQYILRAEKEAITRALSITGGNKARAAKVLGIHRTTLYQKMQRCGLEN